MINSILHSIPAEVQALLLTFDGKKNPNALPYGVKKSFKKYKPVFDIPGGNPVKLDGKYKDPLEAHSYWQYIFCAYATETLQWWSEQDSFEQSVGEYILYEIVHKVLDDWENGRESY